MLLLDTCVLIWLTNDRSRISARAMAALGSSAAELYISAISALEVGIALNKRRVALPSAPDPWFGEAARAMGLTIIPVSWDIAARSTMLPDIHPDPFDRVIIATALARGMPVVTSDGEIPKYPGVTVVW